MTDTENPTETTPKVDFNDLGRERRISERTAQILTYAPDILEAKARGATWKKLAERLKQAGITVAPDYLRALMERHADEIKSAHKGSRRSLPQTVVTRAKAPTASAPTKPPTPRKAPEFTHAADRNDGREA